MEQIKQTILDNIIQIQDVINTLGKPIGNDYSNRTKFSMEARLISNLEKLTNIATTLDELTIIRDITLDLTQSLKCKIKK